MKYFIVRFDPITFKFERINMSCEFKIISGTCTIIEEDKK